MKRPSFQFYPQDWRSDPGLRACTREERSVWLDLLCIMHDSPRRGVLLLPTGQPMPLEEIARNIGETTTKTKHFLEKIAQRGVSSTEEETGALFSRRMVRDEYINQIRSSSGAKGGNPVLLNQNPSKTQASVQAKPKQSLTPSPSSSPSGEGDPRTVHSSLIKDYGPNGKTARKTRAPATLEITDAMRGWASENKITADLDAETAAMLDHHRGKGNLHSDWTATWRTWMRNSKRYGGNNGNGQRRESAAEARQRRNDESTVRVFGRIEFDADGFPK